MRFARLALQAGLGLAGIAALGVFTPPVAAQDLHPSRRPSPMGMARIMVGDTYLRVVYSRPYERGRDNIFGTKESGAVVPYGEVWRTGANEATEITVTGDILVAGKPLAAGTYSLFTTPGPQEWKIHFNRELGLDGAGRFDEATETFSPIDVAATDALTITVAASAIQGEKVEQLTIAFEPAAGGADMVLRWITTEVRVPMKVD
ncbi:MAG TPA: DUF2911 domain-containing protein [Thermoanaerobaculia bacterium]|nr:DUF2911 domain-containing protein [Thermoanaerobaculia bacterium]